MDFTDVRSEDGVTRRSFSLEVDGETAPAVIWAPEDARGPRPLVLMGHGGSQHKKTPSLSARAVRYAKTLGYAVLAIDAPGHGDRISREQAEAYARMVGARVTGQTSARWSPEQIEQMRARTLRAVPEWNAALAAARGFDFVGAEGPVGYWGVSMGTAIGVPFVAQCAEVKAAVFGLAGLGGPNGPGVEAAANRITIPVEFTLQWEDAVVERAGGVALFDAFGSMEKTMHVNPGGHMEIPNFEAASWERFFVRHLGVAG